MSLRLFDPAPDFLQDSTAGPIAFHQWLGESWGVLFSHPQDFTPVCTTELGCTARLEGEFARRGVKVLAVSVDDLPAHRRWIPDIEETQGVRVEFPILADSDREVSRRYGMIHPNASETVTVRSVFIIDPRKRIRAIIAYPAAVGRNFDEILRVVDALQLVDRAPVATPANWRPGDEVIVAPSLADPEALKRRFPGGVRTLKPYLRLAPDPIHHGPGHEPRPAGGGRRRARTAH